MTNLKKIHASNLITIVPTVVSTLMSIAYSSQELRQLMNSSNQGRLQPDAISTIRKLHLNRRNYSCNQRRDNTHTKQMGINYSNLHTIELIRDQGQEHVKTVHIATINMHLVKNKDLLLNEQLNNLEIDLAVLTETWLKRHTRDKAWLDQSELMQNNFRVRTHNRPGQKKGGGIALIHKKSLNIQQLEQGNTYH